MVKSIDSQDAKRIARQQRALLRDLTPLKQSAASLRDAIGKASGGPVAQDVM